MSALDRIIFNLTALADVPRGYRIDSTREYISVDRSYIPSLTRAIRGNGREQTAERIAMEVNLAAEFAELMMENPAAHAAKLKNVLTALRSANIGIKNLRETYTGCTIFGGTIGPVCDKIASTERALIKCLRDLGEY